MIKKVIFTLILCSLIISCGKKGDPIFKESKAKIKIQNITIHRT